MIFVHAARNLALSHEPGELPAQVGFMKSAVFLERDGILNLARTERQQQAPPNRFEDFNINEDAIEPLRRLKEAGFLLIATTNQPGLSRGTLLRREVDLMHMVLRKRFELDDILMCAHDDADRCPCRKPKPGLFQEAAFKWQLDLERSYVISDKWQDAHAAHLLGCTSLLLKSPWNGTAHHDFIINRLGEAADRIFQTHAAPVLAMHQV